MNNMQRYIDDQGRFTIKLSAQDLEDALIEYDLYCSMKGETWEKEWYNYPSPGVFCYIYFGESTPDDVHIPQVYICNSHESATRLYEILKKLEFVSDLDGSTCEVVVDKKSVFVKYNHPDVEYDIGPVVEEE